MRKTLLIISLILLLNLSLANAITQQEINEAKSLTDSKISCDKLTDEQLELIGEYYMEQMHPGESHKLMHKMMGLEEGFDAEKQFHVNMAKRLYCNENTGWMMGSGGMMGMMNMMNGGMMGNYPTYNYGYNSFWNIQWLIFLIGATVLIIWFIYKLARKGKKSETLISILQKRYATGEINKKQFEELKKELVRR